ncbi:MAG: hypothetical protein NW200_09260 [Hyphomonadaceae bacterium]|nr:hypothetical protein [Hyphomonadaceae bacterium]
MAFLQRLVTDMGPAEWLAFVSAIAAAWSFLLNRATVKRQEIMQLESLRAQRNSDLLDWASETIERLADAHALVRERRDGLMSDEEFLRRRSDMRARLSASLDRGRLFFPNAPVENVDESGKEQAFRGKRRPALDALTRAYRVVSDMGKDPAFDLSEGVRRIVTEKRLFVSEVFADIDPRRRRDVLSKLER